MNKYYTYTLTGKTIKQLRKDGTLFCSSWHEGNKIENIKSHKGKVSILQGLFLPNSNNKTLTEQEQMIKDFNPSAFMGNVADYCELAWLHYKKTGERLFGEEYDYNYARTKTPTAEGFVASVGRFDAGYGLHVYYWDPGNGRSYIFAAPLVVPDVLLDVLENSDLVLEKKLDNILEILEKHFA